MQMNCKKTIPIFLILLFPLFTFGQKEHWRQFPFEWEGDSLSGKYFDKVAISVKVNVDHHPFYFQLDLGANYSIIYGNCIKDIPSLYQQRISLNDQFRDHQLFQLKDLKFKLGDYVAENFKLFGIADYGSFLDAHEKIQCGSVGADLFQNKIMIIDFPDKTVYVTDSLNKQEVSAFDFIPASVKNHFLIIPVTINGKVYQLMYDTGSSIFTMVTTKEIAGEFADTARITDELNVTNLGDTLKVKGIKCAYTIAIGKEKSNNQMIWFTENDYFSLNQKPYDGIIGNALFFNRKICLDFKNKRFGIAR